MLFARSPSTSVTQSLDNPQLVKKSGTKHGLSFLRRSRRITGFSRQAPTASVALLGKKLTPLLGQSRTYQWHPPSLPTFHQPCPVHHGVPVGSAQTSSELLQLRVDREPWLWSQPRAWPRPRTLSDDDKCSFAIVLTALSKSTLATINSMINMTINQEQIPAKVLNIYLRKMLDE